MKLRAIEVIDEMIHKLEAKRDGKTCEHCLNAYCNFENKICCVNKDWLAQFEPIEITVQRNETCDSWTARRSNQPPIKFNEPVQLQLFG